MNLKSGLLAKSFVRGLLFLLLIGICSQSASAFPRIFSNDAAYINTYNNNFLCDNTQTDDLIFYGGVVKMIHQKDPTTITNEEFARFINEGSVLISRQKLYEFSRRFGFGGKSFRNWILTNRSVFGTDTEESIFLLEFALQVVIRSGRYGVFQYCDYATSLRRMGGFPGSGSLLPVSERFTLWLGTPASSVDTNKESLPLTTAGDFSAWQSEKTLRQSEIQNRSRQSNDKFPSPINGKNYINYFSFNEATGQLFKTIAENNGLTKDDFKIFSSGSK